VRRKCIGQNRRIGIGRDTMRMQSGEGELIMGGKNRIERIGHPEEGEKKKKA